MADNVSELLATVRAIGEELWERLRTRLTEQPKFAAALGTLVTAIGLVIVVRLVFWMLWASPVPSLGTVSGRVTLDDQPLQAATVEFTPVEGSPSYGLTDSSGHYELGYLPGKAGAALGEHAVRITTYNWVTHSNGSKEEIPERVPARYNANTQLNARVERGSQQLDWALQSF